MSSYVRRWFLVEYEGAIEKRVFECQYVPDHKGYVVKVGCVRDFVPEAKVYETEAAADAKLEELRAEAESV
jgi:hypothetical protein